MQSSIISVEQATELLKDKDILFGAKSNFSTTYYFFFQGQKAVIINTPIENYLITQGS